MPKKPIIEHSEAAFVGKAHNLSVSGSPVDEAAGRAFKAIVPALVQWINDERKRGTDEGVVCAVVPAMVASIAFTTILNCFTDRQAVAEMSDVLKTGVDTAWKDARKRAMEQAK